MAKKSSDIFGSCASPAFLLVIVILIASFFVPSPIDDGIQVLFFFLLGGLCLLNYNKCGRAHCQITGVGFVVVGVLALLNILTILIFPWGWLWILFFIILIVGYFVEYEYKCKKGTCYKK